MNKPCYRDYVIFAMRSYARAVDRERCVNKIDKVNWGACQNILKSYSERDQEILLYVYGAFDTMADNVYAMSTKHHINQNIIWDMMREFELKLAIERGLWV